MRQTALAKSPELFARLVIISASRKSDQATGCAGSSTRASVRKNRRRAGRASRSAGASSAAARQAYSKGGTSRGRGLPGGLGLGAWPDSDDDDVKKDADGVEDDEAHSSAQAAKPVREIVDRAAASCEGGGGGVGGSAGNA